MVDVGTEIKDNDNIFVEDRNWKGVSRAVLRWISYPFRRHDYASGPVLESTRILFLHPELQSSSLLKKIGSLGDMVSDHSEVSIVSSRESRNPFAYYRTSYHQTFDVLIWKG